MTRIFVIGILLGFCSFGQTEDKPDREVIKTELTKLQGTWQYISEYAVGSTDAVTPKELLATISQRLEGNRQIPMLDGVDQKQVLVTFDVDPTKSPKEMDRFVEYMGKKKIQRCIYNLAGDELTIAAGDDDGPRPKGFDVKGQVVTVFKRVKK